MESKIKKLYKSDGILITFFVFFLCVVLGNVIVSVNNIVSDSTSKLIVWAAGITVMCFAANALVIVLMHLKKNKTELYTEDILCSMENNKNSKLNTNGKEKKI